MKLLSYLQQTLWLSRRGFTALVDQWKVFCNWNKIESYGVLVDQGDIIDVDKQRLIVKQISQKSQMIAFYKPAWCVASKSDPHNQTIYQILPPEYAGYYYIGRLDKESRGLLLLTNDTKLVNEYEHPRHGIKKTYLVVLNKTLRPEDIQTCLSWIMDDNEMLRMLSVNIADISTYPKSYYPQPVAWCCVEVVLNEGKKRHIRRMFSALRYHVEDLLRIQEWSYDLKWLHEWQWKLLD